MSRLSRPARLLLGAAACAAVAGPSPARAESRGSTLDCQFPLVGNSAFTLGASSHDGQISFLLATARNADGDDIGFIGLNKIRAASVRGEITANVTLSDLASSRSGTITVPIDSSVVATRPFFLKGTGPYPLGLSSRTSRVTLDSVDLNLRALKTDGSPVVVPTIPSQSPDSDGDPETFDVHCTVAPGASTEFPRYEAGPGPDSTPTPGPTPSPTPGPVVRSYGLAGSATLRTQTRGKVPLSGGVQATIDPATGAVSAALTLDQTQANLVALGVLPIRATVALTAQGPAVGRLESTGALTATATVQVRLPKVTFLGVQLAGAAGCRVKDPAIIALASTGTFDASRGGTLGGTFRLGALTGCGALTGVLSPLLAGGGNTVTLDLTA